MFRNLKRKKKTDTRALKEQVSAVPDGRRCPRKGRGGRVGVVSRCLSVAARRIRSIARSRQCLPPDVSTRGALVPPCFDVGGLTTHRHRRFAATTAAAPPLCCHRHRTVIVIVTTAATAAIAAAAIVIVIASTIIGATRPPTLLLQYYLAQLLFKAAESR